MNVSDRTLRHVRQWIEKAEHDLRNAEHTMTLKEDCPFDTVCFHAQQCAEKYLKGFLVFQSSDFPEVTKEKARNAVELAQRVRNAVRDVLKGSA